MFRLSAALLDAPTTLTGALWWVSVSSAPRVTTVETPSELAISMMTSQNVRQRSLGSTPSTVITGRPSSTSPMRTSGVGQSIFRSPSTTCTLGRTEAKS